VRTLILGGVRSGKSRHAEQLAAHHHGTIIVIVTATAGDAEMAARIAAHRARRPRGWRVVEEPIALGARVAELASPESVLIIDCLTLWLSNLLLLADEEPLQRESEALVGAVSSSAGPLILVSNEVGAGIIPVNQLARRFTDLAGTLHQRLAQVCERVEWMVAGLPLTVKAPPAATRTSGGSSA
jgi:adenosylcobinamide kinase / adenosylcobinamide-phosphate guanylyltransferase